MSSLTAVCKTIRRERKKKYSFAAGPEISFTHTHTHTHIGRVGGLGESPHHSTTKEVLLLLPYISFRGLVS